jgi:EAL domain-containing protein (putative c-di-GMP-specific phosphodiesterase class I)
LSYLRQFPVDILKIDRSFTNLIEGPGEVPPLLEGLVYLGRQLGLELVAEGIELDEQRTQLLRLGCLLGQGFLWARPLECSAVEDLLRQELSVRILARSVPLDTPAVAVQNEEPTPVGNPVP